MHLLFFSRNLLPDDGVDGLTIQLSDLTVQEEQVGFPAANPRAIEPAAVPARGSRGLPIPNCLKQNHCFHRVPSRVQVG